MPRTTKPTPSAPGEQKASKTPRTPKANGAAGEPINDPGTVARRAYEIYQSRGGGHGADLDDWLEAERELKRGPSSITGAAPKPRRRKPADGAAS